MSKSSKSAVLDRPASTSKANHGALRWMADFRFPIAVNARIQALADKNSNGTISPDERKELELFVEAGDLIGIAKISAQNLLKEID